MNAPIKRPLKAGEQDLWIDGSHYVVPTQVASHVKWLQDQNSRFAERLTDYARRLGLVSERPA